MYDPGMEEYQQPYPADYQEIPDMQYIIDPNAEESPITIIQQDHFSLPLAQIS